MPRRWIIHIGYPKTGTTALQMFLARNAAALAGDGILMPLRGWDPETPGHYALLKGLGLRRTGLGRTALFESTLDDVSADQGSVVLSTEALAGMLGRPKLILELQGRIEARGFRVEYVAYLRSQAQMMCSLYAEAVKQGDIRQFSDFSRAILACGYVRMPDRATICLEYHVFLARWAALTERRIHVRSYHAVASGRELFDDFLSVSGASRRASDFAETDRDWTNHRLGPHAVEAHRLLNEVSLRDRDSAARIRSPLLAIAREHDGNLSFEGLDAAAQEEVQRRFDASNDSLFRNWGIDLRAVANPPAGLDWRPVACPDDLGAAAERMRAEARQLAAAR